MLRLLLSLYLFPKVVLGFEEEFKVPDKLLKNEFLRDMGIHESVDEVMQGANLSNYDFLQDPSDNKKCPCGECVIGGVKFIANAVTSKSDEACKKENLEGCDCKQKKRYCKLYNAHPKFTLGLVEGLIRSGSSAYTWCQGHGSCKSPGVEGSNPFLQLADNMFQSNSFSDNILSTIFNEDDALFEEKIFDKLLKNKRLRGRKLNEQDVPEGEDIPEEEDTPEDEEENITDSTEDEKVPEDEDEDKKVPDDEDIPEDEDKGKDKKKRSIDIKCYKKTFDVVLKLSAVHTKKVCEKAECHVLKAWCGWAGKNIEQAYGQIAGRVEPWKFALGRCFKRDAESIEFGNGRHGKGGHGRHGKGGHGRHGKGGHGKGGHGRHGKGGHGHHKHGHHHHDDDDHPERPPHGGHHHHHDDGPERPPHPVDIIKAMRKQGGDWVGPVIFQ